MTALHSLRPSHLKSRGFTLLELAIVLAITGLLFGGLWSLLSTSNQQLEDPGVAQHQQQLTDAVRSFLASSCAQAQTFRAALNPPPTSTASEVAIADLVTCGLLPSGYNSTNVFGQPLEARARDMGNNRYEFIVFGGTGGTDIPDLRGARIASILGSDGGFKYAGAVGGGAADPTLARGAFGAWQIDFDTAAWSVNIDGTATTLAGRVVTYSSTGSDTTASAWLARNASLGAAYNAMTTNLTMSGTNDIIMTGAGNDITMNEATITDAGQMSLDDALGSVTMTGNALNITNNTTGGTAVPAILLTGTTNPLLSIGGVGRANEFQAASFIYTSDERMKMDIKPLDKSLEKILALKGVSFRWKEDHKPSIGFIAQEVEKVFPDVVEKQANGMLGVGYANLLAPTVEAMRALHNENVNLKKQLQDLSVRLEKLEAAGK